MGASSSTIRDTIAGLYRPKHGSGSSGGAAAPKSALALSELLQLPPVFGVEPAHLGVLFALDADRDGVVTLDEALAFARRAARGGGSVSSGGAGALRGPGGGGGGDALAAAALLQGRCSLEMWRALSAPGAGAGAFVDWVVRLVTAGAGPAPGGVDVCGGSGAPPPTLDRSAVKQLYRLFAIERRQGLSFDDFLALLTGGDAAGDDGGGAAGDDCVEACGAAAAAVWREAADGGGGGEESDSLAGASSSSSSSGGSSDGDGGGGSSDAGASAGAESDSCHPISLDLLPSARRERAHARHQETQRQRRKGHSGAPLAAVADFLAAAFDGMGGVIEAILDPCELAEALGGGGGGGGVNVGGGGGGRMAVAH